ncbi:hypothetical protein HDU76_001101 [Blyttiomyces sp. JEL0837]|nr:hypothetical protein HDU76_001101 [Blyttiomyces sp. JEL0837]
MLSINSLLQWSKNKKRNDNRKDNTDHDPDAEQPQHTIPSTGSSVVDSALKPTKTSTSNDPSVFHYQSLKASSANEPSAVAASQTQKLRTAKEINPRKSPTRLVDLKTFKVVVIPKNEVCPEYAAISYVWGNVTDHPGTDYGVEWTIPHTTLSDLNFKLQTVKSLGHKYAWLDVLCLNQGHNASADADRYSELPYMGSYYEHCVECIAFGPNEVLDLANVKDEDDDDDDDDGQAYAETGSHVFGTLKMRVVKGVEMNDYVQVCQLVNKGAEQYKVSTVKWCGMSFDDVGDIKTFLSPPPDVKGIYVLSDNHLLDRLMELLRAFVKSNWGNRVWTLQEACLPPIVKLAVRLYDANYSQEVVPVVFDLDTAMLAIWDSDDNTYYNRSKNGECGCLFRVQASRTQMLGGEGMDWATLKYALATRDSRFVEDRVYGALGLLRNKQHIYHKYGINLSLLDTQVAWHIALELGETILRSADWSFMFGAFPERTKKTKINPNVERVDHGLKVNARIVRFSDKSTNRPPPIRVRWVGSELRQLFVIMPCRPVASEDDRVPSESSSDNQKHDRANYQMNNITDEDWNVSLRWMTILLKRCGGVEDWETARGLAGGLIRTLKETARFEWLYSSWDRVTIADWCPNVWTDQSEEFQVKKGEVYTIGVKNTNLCLDVFGHSLTAGDTVGLNPAKPNDSNVNQRFYFQRTHPSLPIGRLHCKESDLVLEIEHGKQLLQAVPDPDFGRVRQLFDLSGCFLKNGRTIRNKGGSILVGGRPLEVCGNISKDMATVTLGELIFRKNEDGSQVDSNTPRSWSNAPAKQIWLLKDIGVTMSLPANSLFLLSFQVKGFYLDVASSSLEIGDKVGVFPRKPSDRNTNQRFAFEPITPNSKQGFLKCVISNLFLQLEPDKALIQAALDKTNKSQLFDLSECFNAIGEIVPGRILVDGRAMEVTHVNGDWVYLEGMVLDESELDPPRHFPKLGEVTGDFKDPWNQLWKLKECVGASNPNTFFITMPLVKRRLDVFNISVMGKVATVIGIWTPREDHNCENQQFVFKPIEEEKTTTAAPLTAFVGRLQCVESQLYLQLNSGGTLMQTNLDESENGKGQIFDLSGLIKLDASDGSREYTTGKIYVNGFCMGVRRDAYVAMGGTRHAYVGVCEEFGVHQEDKDEEVDETFPEFGTRLGDDKYPWNWDDKYPWNQLWLIEQADQNSKQKQENNFIITLPRIGYCLDVHNDALDGGTEVGIRTRKSVKNKQDQIFTFIPLNCTEERPTMGYLQCVESKLYLELTQTLGLLRSDLREGSKHQIFDLSECIKYNDEAAERSFVVGRILVVGLAMEVCGSHNVAMADPEAVFDEEGVDEDRALIPATQLWHLSQESSASIEVESLVEKLDTSLFWNSPQGVWMHESALDAGDDAWLVLTDVKDEIGTWVGADLLNENGERAGITLAVRTEGVAAEGWHREGTALFAIKEESGEVKSVVLGIKVTQQDEQPEK